MREKETSILIETKDQRKEEREKRGRNERIGGRGINLTREIKKYQKIPIDSGGFLELILFRENRQISVLATGCGRAASFFFSTLLLVSFHSIYAQSVLDPAKTSDSTTPSF